jgi:hypothetical protein
MECEHDTEHISPLMVEAESVPETSDTECEHDTEHISPLMVEAESVPETSDTNCTLMWFIA